MRVLACPICCLPLEISTDIAFCSGNHRFDRARSGYVNLVTPKKTVAPLSGDTRSQLRYRDIILESGMFSPMINALAVAASPAINRSSAVVMDAGCGTGTHLLDFLAACGISPSQESCYAFDVSKDAVNMTAKRLPNATCFVGDIWARWPVLSDTVDVLLNVFAPTSFGEMRRVLRQNGLVLKVFAGRDHLIELRQRYSLIGVEDGKQERYHSLALNSFRHIDAQSVRWECRLSVEQVAAVIGMGPSARHLIDVQFDNGETDATFDLVVLTCADPRLMDLT
jgi:23S rRNA (guanine745-N1)-methyltransferase